MRLQGKAAVVTGAASGLGFAIARAFAQEGARVCLADVNAKGVEAAAKEISGLPVTMDVTDERQVEAGVQTCARELGSVDGRLRSRTTPPASSLTTASMCCSGATRIPFRFCATLARPTTCAWHRSWL